MQHHDRFPSVSGGTRLYLKPGASCGSYAFQMLNGRSSVQSKARSRRRVASRSLRSSGVRGSGWETRDEGEGNTPVVAWDGVRFRRFESVIVMLLTSSDLGSKQVGGKI